MCLLCILTKHVVLQDCTVNTHFTKYFQIKIIIGDFMNENGFVYALEEVIGDPKLFTGRKEEFEFFNKWLMNVPKKLSKSTAILSRRKKGKTAIIERLYNIIYNMNLNIIPFYYEIKEGSKWIVSFSYSFYTSFISQYMGFKLKNIELINNKIDIEILQEIAEKEKLEIIIKDILSFKKFYDNEKDVDNLWDFVQSAPHRIAFLSNNFVIQLIDEFQFMNSEIYWDSEKKRVADDLAGTYLSLAESKIAPMLVTGSWVGWLKSIIRGQLPVRFNEIELGNFTEEEGLESILNYSIITGVDINNDVAVYLNSLVQSDPFYISAVIRSSYKKKDLTTIDGLIKTIEYEVKKGDIYNTWSEYLFYTIGKINKINAKRIVMFLSRHREKEWKICEIINECNLPYTESEAEEVLQQLCKGDLIGEGQGSIRYKGMPDDIFYKVFRYKYGEEIDNYSNEKIAIEEQNKMKEEIKLLQQRNKSLRGLINYNKGHYLEFIMIKYLKFLKFKKSNIKLSDVVENYQQGAEWTEYIQVKNHFINLEGGRLYEIDVFAESPVSGQNLYIEVKNYETAISVNDVEKFIETSKVLKRIETEQSGYFIIYSLNGFTDDAKNLLIKNSIMYSDYSMWKLES